VPGRYLDVRAREKRRSRLRPHRAVAPRDPAQVQARAGVGRARYPFESDGYGFHTSACAGNDVAAERDRTVFVVGDSFTEGIGLPFEQTFAGLHACAWRERHGRAQPRHRHLQPGDLLAEDRGVGAPAQLPADGDRCLLDISDVLNDAVDYIDAGDRVLVMPRPFERRAKQFLKRNSTIFAVLTEFRDRHFTARGAGGTLVIDNETSMWTVDARLYDAWGKRGLERNAANHSKIVRQCAEWKCRLTLVVYPWPDQLADNDRDSIQVRDWSARNHVRFVEVFSPFFTAPAAETLARNYIPNDFHFNPAGNRLVFETVWQTIDPGSR
jgi:hypothetical protein